MYNNSRTFTKGGAIGYLTEGFSYPMGNHNNGVSYYARRNIINIEKILASSSPITPKVLFDAVNQHKSYMNPDNLKLLLEKAFAQNNIDPNIKNTDVFGYTLLHLALHSPDIVKFLLEKGVSPNIPDNFGNTTLDKLMINDNITKQNRIIVTELLLQYGALTELKNSIGWTAIQSAVIYKHIETVKLLILSRANLNVVTPHSYYHKPNKNLIELAPQKSPELKAFLKLAIACNNNDWGVVDKSVTTEDIQKFAEWKISIKLENSSLFSKHLNELCNLKNFLLTKEEFKESEFIGKINNNLNPYITLKKLLIFKMVEQPEIYKYEAGILPEDLEADLRDYELKLTGVVEAEESHSEV